MPVSFRCLIFFASSLTITFIPVSVTAKFKRFNSGALGVNGKLEILHCLTYSFSRSVLMVIK
jgi:hypothetical protein